MLKDYILQSWVLILTLAAFAISLSRTIFLDKKTVKRMYVLIVIVFLLSIDVFLEFYFARISRYNLARTILMAIRYSSTPFIIAQVIYTLIKKMRWLVFIPAIVLGAVDTVSIFTGIVFRVNADGSFTRGPLGLLPFIFAGLYCVFLIYIFLMNSNRQSTEIIPIVFLSFSLGSDLVLPFIFWKCLFYDFLYNHCHRPLCLLRFSNSSGHKKGFIYRSFEPAGLLFRFGKEC